MICELTRYVSLANNLYSPLVPFMAIKAEFSECPLHKTFRRPAKPVEKQGKTSLTNLMTHQASNLAL